MRAGSFSVGGNASEILISKKANLKVTVGTQQGCLVFFLNAWSHVFIPLPLVTLSFLFIHISQFKNKMLYSQRSIKIFS